MKKSLLLLGLSLCLFLNQSFAQSDGSLDLNFAPIGTSAVRAIKKLADGRVLIAHSSFVSGGIKAFNSDGTPNNLQFFPLPQQTEFNGNWVKEIHQQTDGKILLINSVNQPRLFRYNLNGTIDSVYQNTIGTGANLTIRKALLDNNNKLTLIGDFTQFNGVPKNGIVRLNPNGTIDTTFITTCGNCILKDICFNEYGGYFIAGLVNVVNGQATYTNTVKLKANGAVDTTFKAYVGSLDAIAMQPNGQLVGIKGAEAGSGAQKHILRFSLNGLQDSLLASYSGNNVVEIYAQQDGKLLFTGGFNGYTLFNTTTTQPVNRIFRMLPNGTLDPTFDPGSGPDNDISCSQFNSDGSILLGGTFGQFNGQTRTYMARLINSGLPFVVLGSDEPRLAEPVAGGWEVYPNPFTDALFWKSETPATSVELRDISGRTITRHSNVNGPITGLGQLSSGVYLLSFTDAEGRRVTKKIFKSE